MKRSIDAKSFLIGGLLAQGSMTCWSWKILPVR